MAPVDLDKARTDTEAQWGHPIDDHQLASALMYPKVAREFDEHLRRYGDTSVLPTVTFFYGLTPQEEVAVDIEPGKTLLISLQSVNRDEQDGGARLQFELNGQTRTIRLEQPGGGKSGSSRETADLSNPLHIAAPMPGAVVTVAVKAGQQVRPGDVLLALEAMKMETHITADRAARIDRVLVAPGDRVQAKDLLLMMSDA